MRLSGARECELDTPVGDQDNRSGGWLLGHPDRASSSASFWWITIGHDHGEDSRGGRVVIGWSALIYSERISSVL